MRFRRRRRRGRADEELETAAAAAEQMAALLRAGIPASRCWGYLVEEVESPDAVRAAAAHPLDAAQHLSRDARGGPRPIPWRIIGLVWDLGDTTGAPLGDALAAAAETIRDAAARERDLAASRAGPVASARLIAAMPVLALLGGMALGSDSLGALFGTELGRWAGGLGVVLSAVGAGWAARLVRGMRVREDPPGLRHLALTVGLSAGLGPGSARARADELLRVHGFGASVHAGDGERALDIAERSGAPASRLLAGEHGRRRAEAVLRGRLATERLAVRLLLPLGVCGLPAFLLIGVLPVALSLGSGVGGSVTG